MKTKITRFVWAVGFATLAGCGGAPADNPVWSHRFSGDTVYVNPNGPLLNVVKTAAIHSAEYRREIVTVGVIEPIPTRYAYIAPPFPGRVMRSFITMGQHVTANAPLFEMMSPDFLEVQKEYFRLKTERDLAVREKGRKEDLVNNGVGSSRELEEAEALLAIAEKELENAAAALKIYHADPARMELGQPLTVKTPISGNVIENTLITGQYLREDSEPVAVIADLSKVWVTAQVKEGDLRYIEADSEMKITVSAYPGDTITGRIFHIDDSVDEETRSVRVIAECDNKSEWLKLGLFVTVSFEQRPENHPCVEDTALLQDETSTFVYVETAPYTFVKRKVETSALSGGRAVVTSGLEDRDTVIIEQGGYYLK